jgi:putative ABC transport system permease protein
MAAPVGHTLVSDYPEVLNAVRFRDQGSFVVQKDEISFKEEDFIFADSTFFNLFDIAMLEGNPNLALTAPKSVILSRNTAQKYFGNESPLGKLLKMDNRTDYEVTGVFEEIPNNSHFKFDLIASLSTLDDSRDQSWLNYNFNTYILLTPGADPKALEEKFPDMLVKYLTVEVQKMFGIPYEDFVKAGNISLDYFLQPLLDIHLKSDLQSELGSNGDMSYVYIFSAIALFILVIACINFMNLSTARSAGRAKEVGIRKVVGSQRNQLVRQFLTESTIMSIIALLVSLLVVKLSLPYFNNLAAKEMDMSFLLNGTMIISMLVIVLIVGQLAGSYPALFISAFKPVLVLKGRQKTGRTKSWLRSSLVVFQFSASIILIIGTTIVLNQLNFIQNKKLGFDKEQVIVLNDAYLLGDQLESYKEEMLMYPDIVNATISGFLPVPSSRNLTAIFPEGNMEAEQSTPMQFWRVDVDYVKTFDMNIMEGRDFSKDFLTDSSAVIMNQAAVKQFGWDDPLGKTVTRFTSNQGDMEQYTVIGVMEDFHYQSLRNNIGPLIMNLARSRSNISFRVKTDNISAVIDNMKEKWANFIPGQPFDYTFLDERLDEMYRTEQRLSKIFGIFAALAIMIACLGLLGLASFMAEVRTKEIGVRKVMGASISSIVLMLSKEFSKWILVANLVAWPTAWYFMDKWLVDFAYRIDIGWQVFVVSGLIAFVIALLTVTYQAVRAATANPVEALKYE